MAKQVFKGFKQVDGKANNFSTDSLVNGYLYFVRTNDGGTDGYLFFNGKKYGSAEDVSDVLNAKIGTLPEGYSNVVDYINDQISAITRDYATKEAVGTLSGRVDTLEAISAGTRLDTLEAVSASTRLTNLETSAATFATTAKTEALQTAIDAATARTEEVAASADTRLTDLEASAHTHSNKALLDTYTQTEENLADAVSKKHEHSNKSVLDGITAEKVADWDEAAESAATKTEVGTLSGRVDTIEADYLKSSDKTELEGTIGTLSGRVDAIETGYTTNATFDAYTAATNDALASADTRLDALEAISGDSHTHSNKSVLDGITAEKVTAWDSAEQDAKDYADGLKNAMNADISGANNGVEVGVKQVSGVVTEVNVTAPDFDDTYAPKSLTGTVQTNRTDFDNYTAATDSKIEALSGISADTRIAALEAISGNTNSALQEVVSGDTSVTVGAKDANNKQTVAVKVSDKSDNALELISDNTNDGLYVMPIFYYEEGDELPSN